MESVFNLILNGFVHVYTILNDFVISAYGFSFSMWDLFIAFFVLAGIVPILVAPSSAMGFSAFVADFHAQSERNDREQQRQDYYNERSKFYKSKADYYNSKRKK